MSSLKGPGPGREAAIRACNGSFNNTIITVTDMRGNDGLLGKCWVLLASKVLARHPILLLDWLLNKP